VIIRHQKNVGGFAGAHSFWFLPSQLIEGAMAAAGAALTYTSVGKFFLFTASEWASAVIYKLETTFRATTGEVGVRLFDVTAGAEVAGSEVLTSATALARYRSGAVTLVDGNEYRIQVGVDVGAAGAIVGASVLGLTPP
jgi:hypothetical protein